MPRKIDPQSRDDEILSATICEMLKKKKMVAPLCITWLVDCVEMLPINVIMVRDSVFGRWVVSNQDVASMREHKQTDFSGLNFTVIEYTLEKALSRAIHYYYHTEEKNNGLLHCEI